MRLTLQSDLITDRSTGSELLIDGVFECYTLELPIIDGMPGSAIPAGEYSIKYEHSPKFGRLMPHIDGIPNRSLIMLHWGNDPHDTDGCVLVGDYRDPATPDFVGHSRVAWDRLNARLAPACSAGEVKIEVIRRV